MANDLRAQFEAQASDPSFKFARSRKGTYVNPALARDWKWFQAGAVRPATEAAAMAATVPALNREVLTDLIAEHLRGTYHCTRVWHAWSVGTMGEDDFGPVEESDTPTELADAIITKLATPPLTDCQIKAAIHGAVKSGRLSWMGYEKDAAGQYTVPVLSPSHYQLARAIEAVLQAPVAGQPAEPSPACTCGASGPDYCERHAP